MRVLVVTVVHYPSDSRIRFREINALLDAGWDVTYAAPFTGYGLAVPESDTPACLDVPRAQGRNRAKAWRGAREIIMNQGPEHDVIVLHDPELLTTLPRLALPPVVWDVHEDTAAAVTLKPWLPGVLRRPVRWAYARAERAAEKHLDLILAEYAYSDRFANNHVVVPNVTRVPATVKPPDEPRVMYVGSMTAARGTAEMVETARIVHEKSGGAIATELIGPADNHVAPLLQQAADEGVLDWPGVLPNDQAMARLDGALAGLSLLRDEPNYRVSMPTKVTDYIAHGVPVITTPLPLAESLVNDSQCGIVVPFNDPQATADAVLTLWNAPEKRRAMGRAGHETARAHYDWTAHAERFVRELERIAKAGHSTH